MKIIIANYLEFDCSFSYIKSFKEVCLEITNYDNFVIKDAPPKFEDDIKSIII